MTLATQASAWVASGCIALASPKSSTFADPSAFVSWLDALGRGPYRAQVVGRQAEGAPSPRDQTSVSERGPHQSVIAMPVQAKQQVTEFVGENPPQGSRVDLVVDLGESLAVPVPIDGPRHLFRPQRQTV